MNFYPAELVTPPLALVALLGCPGLHGTVGEFLRSQHKPPINSLGLAEPWAASRLFGERKSVLTAPSDRTGILKADWFTKHRQKRPAAALLFLERAAVVGSGNEWAVACSALEAVRAASRSRGAQLVIAVVGPRGDLPEERAGALARIGAIEKKWLVTFDPAEGEPGLRRLGRLLYEAAGQFYLDAARRRLSVHAEKRTQTPEMNARVAFKAAALAEFRADWATAVKTYQTAYSEVARVGLGPPLPLQRAFEVAAVAEQVHIKSAIPGYSEASQQVYQLSPAAAQVVTLLLHQQRVQEALAHFRAHLSLFRRPPFAPPPAFAAAHAGWVARQHAAMAELLAARADGAILPAQRDAQPAHFHLCCAHAAIERRQWAAKAADARGGRPPRPLEPYPVPGAFVGQVVILDPQRRLTDDEFVQYLEVQEAGTDHSRLALDALGTAQELCARVAGARGTRQAYYVGQLIAREHLAAGDAATAHRLLLLVAGIYRREQWRAPLASALLDLRSCAARLEQHKDAVQHSLELSALRGSLPDEQRSRSASEAVATMTSAASDASQGGVTDLQLHVKPVNHPLLSCFALCAGFREPAGEPAGSEMGADLTFGFALRSCLPVDVPYQGAEVSFASHGESEAWSEDARPARMAAGESLKPGEWAEFSADVLRRPRQQVTATEVCLRIGSHAAIRWQLPTMAGFEMIGGSGQDGALDLLTRLRPAFTPGVFERQLAPAQPPMELVAEGEPFALVGESVAVGFRLQHARPGSAASLTVRAGFLEGIAQPELTATTSDGTEHRSAGAAPLASEGVHSPAAARLGPLGLAPGQARQDIRAAASQRGQLQVSAVASVGGGGSEGGTAEAEATASLEITVEDPLALAAQFSTAAGTQSLILPVFTTDSETGEEQLQTLPVDELCFISAQLRVTAPVELGLASVSAELPDGVECLGSTADACRRDDPVPLHKGDVFTAVFRIRCAAARRLDSLGHLLVSWKRRRRGDDGRDRELIQSLLALPGVDFRPAAIQVEAHVPGSATAGEPCTVRLSVRNLTAQLQQVTVAVSEASGFVVAGGRHEALSVLPHRTMDHTLALIGYAPGPTALPQVRLTALRHGAVVEPLAGRSLVVCPARVARSSAGGRPRPRPA